MRTLSKARRAEEDLIEIWGYVARESETAADRLLDRFEEHWRLLIEHPFAGAARADIAAGIRYLVTGNYLTFYRVDDDAVVILRVLHGKRDITAGDLGT